MDAILKDHLGITYPTSDVKVMEEPQCHAFYGSSGVLKTYKHLVNSSYGVRSKKMEETKAQTKALQMMIKKAKGHSSTQNTSLEDDAINNSDATADAISLPSNQLAQKRRRAASPEITAVAPQYKKGKHHGPSEQSDEELDSPDPSVRIVKGKRKVVVLVPDSDIDMNVVGEDTRSKSVSPTPVTDSED